ncbi:hypothetical protein MtrunA17_Chr4g0012281 [Medicago truncatula]|uniref:Uncharacterized protein n=1 Tax=Medicago truncatula TaxID=3880 RepID=A0A396I147_MEDTR|nr:hypothetical protein MtrunA17_Chr4g0012281 [Medicago truncatula]
MLTLQALKIVNSNILAADVFLVKLPESRYHHFALRSPVELKRRPHICRGAELKRSIEKGS